MNTCLFYNPSNPAQSTQFEFIVVSFKIVLHFFSKCIESYLFTKEVLYFWKYSNILSNDSEPWTVRYLFALGFHKNKIATVRAYTKDKTVNNPCWCIELETQIALGEENSLAFHKRLFIILHPSQLRQKWQVCSHLLLFVRLFLLYCEFKYYKWFLKWGGLWFNLPNPLKIMISL